MCLLLLRLYTSSLPIVRVEKPFSEYFKVLRVLSAAAYSGNKPAEHREREIELEEKQKFTLGRFVNGYQHGREIIFGSRGIMQFCLTKDFDMGI